MKCLESGSEACVSVVHLVFVHFCKIRHVETVISAQKTQMQHFLNTVHRESDARVRPTEQRFGTFKITWLG